MDEEKHLILMIDDDRLVVDFYSPALRSAIEENHLPWHVVEMHNVDKAWMFWRANKGMVRGVVLELMMPPGLLLVRNPATRAGLRTGLVLLKKFKEHIPDLPAIFLTNATDAAGIVKAGKENHTLALHKVDLLPEQLAQRAIDFFSCATVQA